MAIDYRPVIVQYIKDNTTIVDPNVKDGALTFKQPNTDYATYYILDESKASFVNDTTLTLNQSDNTLLDQNYNPLTIVTMSIDIRGINSFANMRDLRNSFDTISNKEALKTLGVSYMGIGAVSSLPQLKNTKQEEGYLFDLTFSFDNTHVDTVPLSQVVTVGGTILKEG
jgi:hypothetical protein